ncbi:MAG: Rpn family recombination-promoting nuclease/putative transposase [Verrucomicrobia bacterium]|nr:Rpn family recombination-promoting nuclease/putative transposase [Verrucomicrobiota bacterium]
MHFLDPTNDYAFRRVFGDEKKKGILISFLNSILGCAGDEQIVDVKLLDPRRTPRILGAKETILDVRCHDQKGHEYIVEMQVLKQEYFDKRVLYYASQAYTEQLSAGVSYGRLKPVIFLGILSFSYTANPHWLSMHQIVEVETKEHKLKDFKFTFVELPKFSKTEKELTSIADKWAYFLKHARDLEAIPEVIYEEAIKEAFHIVNESGWSKEELRSYERRKMDLMDQAAISEAAFKEAVEKAVEQAVEKAVEQAVEKTRLEARAEERREMASNLLLKGYDLEIIHQVTKISFDDLHRLSREIFSQ